MSQPQVKVGIMSAPEIRFHFPAAYLFAGKEICGEQTARFVDGKVEWNGTVYETGGIYTAECRDRSFRFA